MVLPPDFRDLLSALADSSAEYLVVGGWAVGVHAEPRFTNDLDILVGKSDKNLTRSWARSKSLARRRVST